MIFLQFECPMSDSNSTSDLLIQVNKTNNIDLFIDFLGSTMDDQKDHQTIHTHAGYAFPGHAPPGHAPPSHAPAGLVQAGQAQTGQAQIGQVPKNMV